MRLEVQPLEARGTAPRGVTPSINRQGGQHLKKIITPKKYLRFAKNTDCGEMDLTRPSAHRNYEETYLCLTLIWGSSGQSPLKLHDFEQNLVQ